jgi:ABC-type glycerol-3-phosphate transport system substrate-binding protein
MRVPGDVLRLWHSSSVYGETAPFYVDGFRKLGKELKLEIELKLIPWSRSADTIISAFKNGNPPDVLQLGTTFIQTMANLGYLSAVPETMALKPSLADWIDGYCRYKGRLVAVPWLADTIIMAARQDMLDRFGISREDISDWEGFYRVCELLADEGRKKKGGNNRLFPVVFPIRPENGTFRCYVSWLLSSGWQFPALRPIPAGIFEDGAVIRAFEYISRLIQVSGITTKDVRLHPQHLFEQFASQGRYVFFIGNWGGVLSDIIRHPELFTNKGTTFSIMPIPSLSPAARPWGGGSVLAVSSTTKYPEAAWRVVEYMYSDAFINQWASNSGDIPAFYSPFWEENSRDKHLSIMYDQIKRSCSYPLHPMWLRIEKYLSEDFANFLWRMMNGRILDSETNMHAFLQRTDRNVIDFLKMAWEMDNV